MRQRLIKARAAQANRLHLPTCADIAKGGSRGMFQELIWRVLGHLKDLARQIKSWNGKSLSGIEPTNCLGSLRGFRLLVLLQPKHSSARLATRRFSVKVGSCFPFFVNSHAVNIQYKTALFEVALDRKILIVFFAGLSLTNRKSHLIVSLCRDPVARLRRR